MRHVNKNKFAHLPTPIEFLPRLSTFLGGTQLFVKRDDQTGLVFGGNKTRKLEFLIANAEFDGADTLITTGSVQSNHCRQTAAASARFGFDCYLVLTGEKPEGISGNLLLDRMLGCKIIWTNLSNRDQTMNDVYDSLCAKGRKPYIIPYGGSNVFGVTAYIKAFEEFVEQISSNASPIDGFPDWIVLASSSGGTQAGLVIGAKECCASAKLLGISIDKDDKELIEIISSLARETVEFLDLDITILNSDINVNANYLGLGYGIPGDRELEAIELFLKYEGILLDPVYTGRAAGGMIDLIRSGFIKSSESVLFWHTGGTPAIFADQYSNMLGNL